MTELKNFLVKTDGPKFVVSPVMLLPRHARASKPGQRLDAAYAGALQSDGWDGYPETMREVLGFIAEKQIRNVVFLSGDEHRACVATAELNASAGTMPTRIHSVHASAMYAPFPFANSIDEEFIDHETFDFNYGANTFRCTVDTVRPAKRDGPTYFLVRKSGSLWLLDCEFADGSRQTLTL
jgi:phosphodiesterase/alkaline phosphatase D-like protein